MQSRVVSDSLSRRRRACSDVFVDNRLALGPRGLGFVVRVWLAIRKHRLFVCSAVDSRLFISRSANKAGPSARYTRHMADESGGS